MRILFLLFLLFITLNGFAQKTDKPFIKLIQPLKENNNISSSPQFIVGSVCKTCTLTINETPVQVYPTGGFAYQLNLKPGDNRFELLATNQDGKSIKKKVAYSFVVPAPPDTVKTLAIESIQTFPQGDLALAPGDKIEFKVKTLTGCTVKAGDLQLDEMPTTQTKGIPGIYQLVLLVAP